MTHKIFEEIFSRLGFPTTLKSDIVTVTLKLNKNGSLGSDPIFEDGKVIFPSFTNPEVAREGETWEVELVKTTPLNKVDKKGRPMFKGIYHLKEKK